MARRVSQVRFLNRVVAPIVLGLLFLAYILDALFPADDPIAVGVFTGLTIISLILTVAFAGLLVEALYSRRENWRVYAIYLGAVVAIWIVGSVLHVFLPRPQL